MTELEREKFESEFIPAGTNCPKCGKPLFAYRKKMPDYLGEHQYGCEQKVCHNLKCSLGIGRVAIRETWMPVEKIKELKVDAKTRRKQIDAALLVTSEEWLKEHGFGDLSGG